ncbi:MAG: TrkH family potassium uptake protein [Bacteroidales bacterium]|nr:TrkH family potassium uptake protein [Bacteroidales bacterium]MBN2755862.1 TrkH family potassium uptake protein [Bacteroidales bacterium]
MKKEIIIKHLGFVLMLNGLFMFISFLISLFLDETSTLPLLYSALLCGIFGVFPLIFVERTENINFNEGLTIVVFGWIITSIAGMLPYIMWGGEFTLINAWFESVSGFTTTGSTILNNIEILPKGLLFWRSSTHWIGGIGIILFVLLILPQAQGSRISIYNTEISSLSKLNFRFKARKIVHVLAIVYISLTLLETTMLTFFGMSFFDAVNHSFATIATGGFSTKNLSIAEFNNLGIEITIMIFMVLSGIHFGLIYGTVMLKKENIFKSSLVKSFIIVMFIGILLVAFKLYLSGYYNWWQSLRYAAFQVISLGSTTGFATQDTANWPIFTQMILIYFTIQCAMTGSTSGGLKFDRVYIFFKSVGKQIKMLKHPKGIFVTKLDDKRIDEKLEQQTLVFVVLYIFTFFMTTFILTALDIDGMTAFSASIATIGNVGPGFQGVSSLGNFANIPDLGKFVLTINMLLGRLEIFNILALIMIKK